MKKTKKSPSEPVILVFDPARQKRAHMALYLQHGIAALTLILTGYEKFTAGPAQHAFLAVVEILIGIALIAAIIYEKKYSRPGAKSIIPVVDTLAAAVLLFEGINHVLKGSQFIQYAYFLVAIITFLAGTYRQQFGLRNHFRLDPARITFRKGLFGSISIAWSSIASITFDGHSIIVKRKNKSLIAIDLKKAVDKTDLSEKLFKYAASCGFPPDALITSRPPSK